MKVLVAHNSYQHAGGEDAVFDNEARLLRQSGHEVREYLDDNHRIAEFSSTRLGIDTMWSRSSYKKLSAVLADSFLYEERLHSVSIPSRVLLNSAILRLSSRYSRTS